MNIYLFNYEDENIDFTKMLPSNTFEEAASTFHSMMSEAFNGLYDDIDPTDCLKSVLLNHGALPKAVPFNKNDEVVTCLYRSSLTSLPAIENQHVGILSGEEASAILKEGAYCLYSIRRGDCEQDSDFKQIIPYVILRHDGKYFAYKRLSGSGEQRLVNQISIGVGGHMNLHPKDGDYEALISSLITEATRELEEELVIGNDVSISFDTDNLQILNDDANEVGRVHIGVVMVVDLDSDNIRVRETDSLEGGFVTEEYLLENEDKLESWTNIYLKNKTKTVV